MIPLINRTHYSIHRAFSKPKEIAQRAKALGYEAVGLCDFHNVSAAIEFIEECKSAKIKPIIGCDFGEIRTFCKNFNGWKKLLAIHNEFSIHGRLDRVSLGSSDLITFTDELPDCRYVNKLDEESYRILRCLGLKIKLKELTENTAGFHMASPNEIPENPIYGAFGLVEAFEISAPPRLPKFSDDEVELLWDKVRAGFDKFIQNMPVKKTYEYLARLRYEMQVIELGNLAGYFLIVSDFVNKGRADGQLCSIGRGSSAGCFISYLIGINLVEPVKYGLLFSRFFNAARSYPKHLSFDEYPFIDEFRDFEAKYLEELEVIKNTAEEIYENSHTSTQQKAYRSNP